MVQTISRNERRSEADDLAPLNAPLFHKLIEKMQEDRRYVVLDLGPALRETIAAFSGLRCRLDIVDLADDIDRLNAEMERDDRRALAEDLVGTTTGQPADIVLCWDLLNYLERPALKAVMKAVADRTRREAEVHALVAYSSPDMAAAPNHYLPDGEHHLRVVPVTTERRKSPRYSPEDLARCMPAYRMDRAMLLRNGMQEYLFRL